jgi:hypothetical protein
MTMCLGGLPGWSVAALATQAACLGTTGSFDPAVVGALPPRLPGRVDVVVTLLGSSGSPSHLADGSQATDLLGTCSLAVDVAPTDPVVHLRVRFGPVVDVRRDCRIDRVEAAAPS